MIIWTDGSITLSQYLFMYPNNVERHLSYFKMHYECVQKVISQQYIYDGPESEWESDNNNLDYMSNIYMYM